MPRKAKSLRVPGPVEIAAVLLVCFGIVLIFKKQYADGLVAQCALRHERGDFSEALELCEQALAIYLQLNDATKLIPGVKDGLLWADVAQTTDNIGVVNMNIGNSVVALQYHEQALRMRTSKLGFEHPDVAATKDNMGLVYRQVNQLDKALEMHNEALQIRLKTLNPRDLAVCATKTAIANVYYQREEYLLAMMLYDEVLQAQEEALGEDHVEVATTLQNLGAVLKHSNTTASLERYERSLAILVGMYGHKHRGVADTLNSMGGVRFVEGRWDDAMQAYQQSLDITVSLLGASHPDVAATLSNMGAVLDHLNRTDEARDYYRQAGDIWQMAGMEWAPDVSKGAEASDAEKNVLHSTATEQPSGTEIGNLDEDDA
mmetsp:Transcript_46911/g.124830  ORF Transcript_46911/g.124830 Transcript_46911/m.124830 type:complete len:374 (+) Transcript_46911:146-1267(+)|eukprot:CAMPEP_0113669452 /NCGR_PEP_ID=MMETSP0038_2-20120614/4577_1 /TAXON_ID=2898 /ORGANISM="Cryptomonas paramecium" /LENGTH=373 /DNA_ID=CAMNT_0000585335 /DNA_START=76 /DNA_END=1197 /DNA_ORIENTATION=- /assembly_acc=CAM_ASM_000170